MECLNRLIGIWDGCTERDADVLYINDLPGFDLSIPEQLNKEQDDSPMGLLTKIRAKSSLFLKNEFLANLNPRVEMGSVLFAGIAGKVNDNKLLKALQVGKYGGVQIGTPGFPYTEIYIDQIGWFAKDVITTTVHIFDLTRGVEIDSFPITTIADDITYISVEKTYKNKGQYLNLIVVIDAGLTDTYEVTTLGSSCNSCFQSVRPLSKYSSGRGVKIPIGAIKIETNLQGEYHTSGIIIHYSVNCDHDYFLCQIAKRLTLSMYYRFGIELMNEIINSPRLNSLTTVRMEKAKTMKKELIDQYNDALGAVMKNLQLPNNACYHCEPLITVKSSIP